MADLRLGHLLDNAKSALVRTRRCIAGRMMGWPKAIAKLLVFVGVSTIGLAPVSAEPCKMPEGGQEFMHDLTDPSLTVFIGEVVQVDYFEDDAGRTCRQVRYDLDYVVLGKASNPTTIRACDIPYAVSDLPNVDRLTAEVEGFYVDARVLVGATKEGVAGPYPTNFRFNCDEIFHALLRRGVLESVYQFLEERGVSHRRID